MPGYAFFQFWLLKWMLMFLMNAVILNAHNIRRRYPINPEPKKVVCYHANWSGYRPGNAKFSPEDIKPSMCTHLIYAFSGLDEQTNKLKPSDEYADIQLGGYSKFTALKSRNNQLKTMLSVGGTAEGPNRFSAIASNKERRKIFIKNIIKTLRDNNFDGIDIDWQYPTFKKDGKSTDKQNHASLIKELRQAFNTESTSSKSPRLLLTLTAPSRITYVGDGYDIATLNRYVDFMNVLTYDYHTASESSAQHHAPLRDGNTNIDATMKYYFGLGVDHTKLIMGIPTYGRTFKLSDPTKTKFGSPTSGPGEKGQSTGEDGYLAYFEICKKVKEYNWTEILSNSGNTGPYAYHDNQWVGYDDEESVRLKAKYANENNLGGIMFWTVNNDDFRGECSNKAFPLIEAGKEALFASTRPNGVRGGGISSLRIVPVASAVLLSVTRTCALLFQLTPATNTVVMSDMFAALPIVFSFKSLLENFCHNQILFAGSVVQIETKYLQHLKR